MQVNGRWGDYAEARAVWSAGLDVGPGAVYEVYWREIARDM